jgi:hypothetical protein
MQDHVTNDAKKSFMIAQRGLRSPASADYFRFNMLEGTALKSDLDVPASYGELLLQWNPNFQSIETQVKCAGFI